MEKFDVIILGAGSAGYVAAIRLGDLGKRVLIVENKILGGTCLNRGCIPTKAILKASEIYRESKESKIFGINIDNVSYDPKGIKTWKDNVIKKLVLGVEYLLKSRKVEIKYGRGYLVDGNIVEVETSQGKERFEGKDIIIATGSEPLLIPAFKIDHINVLTSDDALELTEYPKEMVIVGAGAIGMEFATFFNSFGTKVTVVEMMENVVPTLKDKKIANLIKRIYEKRGINFKLGVKIENIDIKDNRVYLTLGNGEILETEKVLVSIGRKLNSDNIGLEKVGIQTDKGKIVVNEYLKTNVDHHYAIGDVVGGLLLAHKAMKEGEVVAEIIVGYDTKMDYRVVPWAIFTTPEIASVGITEEEAKENGIDVITGEFPFIANGKAVSMNSTDGIVKVVAKSDTKEIIGAQIVGPDASVMIAEVALAIKNKLTLKDISDTIHTHPTLSEAIMEATKVPLGEAIHIVVKR
ncbi:MAG: dihydrolipoyl dehydrogenase [Caldisericia bacterium]|jgi:dihydrolipoamide dehydrogenase|nr:dihydrolipoyl dehydrogenase [Caldisericia bacterium]